MKLTVKVYPTDDDSMSLADLQGETEELSEDDIRNWKKTKQELIYKFIARGDGIKLSYPGGKPNGIESFKWRDKVSKYIEIEDDKIAALLREIEKEKPDIVIRRPMIRNRWQENEQRIVIDRFVQRGENETIMIVAKMLSSQLNRSWSAIKTKYYRLRKTDEYKNISEK